MANGLKTPTPKRESAFDAELLAYDARLRRESLRLMKDPDDAQDLVQDTYLRALRSSDRFSLGTNLKAWLLSIARNAASNRWRDRRRRDTHLEVMRRERLRDEGVTTSDTPEDALLREALDPQLKAALEALPATLRQAIWQRDVEERSYAELAKAWDVPIGTVMSRIARARDLLFAELVARIDPPAGGHRERLRRS